MLPLDSMSTMNFSSSSSPLNAIAISSTITWVGAINFPTILSTFGGGQPFAQSRLLVLNLRDLSCCLNQIRKFMD